MNRSIALSCAVLVMASSAQMALAFGATSASAQPSDSLTTEISTLDSLVFDSFNHCKSPEQLQKHASYFAPDVEFYHDNGGVTWTRDAMLANTRNNACGNYRRELVRGSLKVFPVKNFGAIEQGVHRFCQVKSGECEGIADFVIIWHQDGGKWLITRVLSYGHRPNSPSADKVAGR